MEKEQEVSPSNTLNINQDNERYDMRKYYQIIFYVPKAHSKQVKQKMFDAGAGSLGNYQECSWQTLGEGQFKPLKNSHPFIGEANKLETVAEYKVEMICHANKIKQVIHALKDSHPYEEPAYSVIELLDI